MTWSEQAVFDQPGRDTDDDWAFHQAVADAATAKSLRQVLAWLRGFEAAHGATWYWRK